jgi:hypothetical protein
MFENCKQNKTKQQQKKEPHAWTHIVHEHNRCNPWLLAYPILELPCLILTPDISYPTQVKLAWHMETWCSESQFVSFHSFQSSWKSLKDCFPCPKTKCQVFWTKVRKASFTRASFCTSSLNCAMDWKQSIECLAGTQIQILKLTILNPRLD